MRRAITFLAVAAALTASTAAAAGTDPAAERAARWLAGTRVEADGNAADTAVALRAAGRLQRSDAARRAATIRAAASAYATTAGATGKTILGLVATGQGNPRCAGGIDLVSRLTGFRSGGRYGRSAWDQALALISLRAVRVRPPASAARYLLAARGKGGWNYALSRTGRDDVTHTALAILGLRAAGVSTRNRDLAAGLRWMLAQRTTGGGFGHERRDRNEANATALAVQALRAVGRRDKRGLDALRGLQRPDGSVQLSAADAGNTELATVDAVVALSGRYIPVAPLSRRPASCS